MALVSRLFFFFSASQVIAAGHCENERNPKGGDLFILLEIPWMTSFLSFFLALLYEERADWRKNETAEAINGASAQLGLMD